MPYTTPIFGFTAPLEDELAYLMPNTLQAMVVRLEAVLKDRAAVPDLATLNAVVGELNLVKARLVALESTAWATLPVVGGTTFNHDSPVAAPCQYRREGRRVWLRGWGIAGRALVNGDTIANALPAGFAPGGASATSVFGNRDGALHRIDVDPSTGRLVTVNNLSAGQYINLGTMSWPLI